MFTGEKLRLLRQLKQKKQEEIAHKLGITQQRYSALENKNEISEKLIEKILETLKYSKEEAERIVKLVTPPRNNRQWAIIIRSKTL